MLSSPQRNISSVIWSLILKAANMLHDGFRFKVWHGIVLFWYDSWLDIDPLCSLVPCVNIQDTEFQVQDIYFNRTWHFEILATTLPDVFKEAILRIFMDDYSNIRDVMIMWKDNILGIYHVKLVYR